MNNIDKITEMLKNVDGLSQDSVDKIAENGTSLSDEQKNRILSIIEQKENLQKHNEVPVHTITSTSKRNYIIRIIAAAACMCVVCIAALNHNNGKIDNPPKVSQDSDIYVKISEETTSSDKNKAETVTKVIKQEKKENNSNSEITSSPEKETKEPETVSELHEKTSATIKNVESNDISEKKPDTSEVSVPSESEIKEIYSDLLDTYISANGPFNDFIFVYYDMNNDSIPELIIAQNKMIQAAPYSYHEYKAAFYTVKNKKAVCVGEDSLNIFSAVSVDNNTGRIVIHGRVKENACCVSYVFDGDTVKPSDSIRDYVCPVKSDSNINDFDESEYVNMKKELFDLTDIKHGYLKNGERMVFLFNHGEKTEPYYYFMDENT